MTDTSVQFFSQLNGLTLSNNWGDLIRLLDICLVNGKILPTILLQSVDKETGDITLEFSANHNCLLFQIIELNGFSPEPVNGKYRIKTIIDGTKLVLKADDPSLVITSIGILKLASLGYEIIYRDSLDVKRVYKARNPSVKHPYIRVDESIKSSDDGVTGTYPSTYAKSAMVGLLSNMTHIDDFENPLTEQLPYNGTDPKRNWTITGTNTTCKRGWSKWYWANSGWWYNTESGTPSIGNRQFSLIGDADAFYLTLNTHRDDMMVVYGCGLYENSTEVQYPWFLASYYQDGDASVLNTGNNFYSPFSMTSGIGFFKTLHQNGIGPSVNTQVIFPTSATQSGTNTLYNNDIPALSLPIVTQSGRLLGNLKHINFAGKKVNESRDVTTLSSGASMYLWHLNSTWPTNGGFYYYMGELYETL